MGDTGEGAKLVVEWNDREKIFFRGSGRLF